MVDAYFGADKFRPALGRYVEAYEDGVADSPEFFDIIGRETGEPNLTRAFRSFVEQNGLPLISVEQTSPNTLELTQSRYGPLGTKIADDRTWVVPFCFYRGTVDGRNRLCLLLDEKKKKLVWDPNVTTENETRWFLPNAGGTGYYRFSMPYDMWQDLGRNFGGLSAGEKLSTLDSVGAEFAAGRIDVQTVWRFIDEAVRDDERRVVQAAIREAGKFERLLANDGAALAGYRASILDVFRYRYEALDQHGGDDPELAIMKSSLERFLIRTGQDESLRDELAAAAATFIGLEGATSDRAITTDEYLTSMAVGLQVYGEPFLERLLAARGELDDPVFEQAAAYALGQNQDPELVERILDLALSGDLGSRETRTIARGQMRQAQTRDATWAWVQANFPTYLEVIPRQRKRSSPALADAMCSMTARDDLIALFEQYGDLAEGHERALTQTIERIELCSALEVAKGEEVRAFFRSRG